MNWTPIILAILALISAIMTTIIAPLVKNKLTEAQLTNLDYWMRVLIAAAETEIDGEKMGEAKKMWVLGKLKAMGIDFDEAIISAAIDGICRELTAEAIIN